MAAQTHTLARPVEGPPVQPFFRALDLPTELRLMILRSALTLPNNIYYTCPHSHMADPWGALAYACTHREDGCDHEVQRPSTIAHEDGRYMFWLLIVANKKIYQESAEWVVRSNTIVFSHETLLCFHQMQWESQIAPKTHESILLSEQVRTIEVLLDFTWVEDLADDLAPLDGIEELTFTATQTWLQPQMIHDFRRMLKKLPKLKICKIEVKKEEMMECAWFALGNCSICVHEFERASRVAEEINNELARALAKRARRRASRAREEKEQGSGLHSVEATEE